MTPFYDCGCPAERALDAAGLFAKGSVLCLYGPQPGAPSNP